MTEIKPSALNFLTRLVALLSSLSYTLLLAVYLTDGGSEADGVQDPARLARRVSRSACCCRQRADWLADRPTASWLAEWRHSRFMLPGAAITHGRHAERPVGGAVKPPIVSICFPDCRVALSLSMTDAFIKCLVLKSRKVGF